MSRKLQLEASNSSLARRQEQQRNFHFRIYAHNVFAYERAEGGYVEERLIQQQIQIMNGHYRSAGISFTLDSVSYTRNSHWAHGNDELGMKRNLRRGGYADLNMYFLASIPKGSADGSPTIGYCYSPVPHQPNDFEFIRDGCMVAARTVPGVEGWINQNWWATHEVGHYLGLYHTFEKGFNRDSGQGCSPGDYIDDTYPQENPSHDNPDPRVWACGGWQQSNMDNFMDYTTRAKRFTPEQEYRMGHWANVRQKIAAGNP